MRHSGRSLPASFSAARWPLSCSSLHLRAGTRHTLWMTALVAIALIPLFGMCASVVRSERRSPGTAGPAALHLRTTSAHTPSSATIPARAPAVAGTRPAAAEARAVPSSRFPEIPPQLALRVIAVWALGALGGLAGLGWSLARIAGLKRRSSPLEAELADQLPWLTQIGNGREIYLRLSHETETPVAIGFLRPVILIPTELAVKNGLGAIESLIVHEHAHLRRCDDWTNLVQRAIERIFWCNPLVWYVGRRIALEREISADDAVVDRTGDPQRYAMSLWQLVREMRMPASAVVAPGALLTRKQIGIRIESLLSSDRAHLRGSPIVALGGALAAAGAIALVFTSAPAVELPQAATPNALARNGTPAEHSERRVLAGSVRVPAESPSAFAVARIRPVEVSAVAQVPAVSAGAKARPERAAAAKAGAATAAPWPQHPVEMRNLPRDAYSYSYSFSFKSIAPQIAAAVRDAVASSRWASAAAKSSLVKVQVRTSGEAAAAEAAAWQTGARAPGHGSPEVSISDNVQAEGSNDPTVVPPTRKPLTRDLIKACDGCSLRGADLHGLDLHGLRLSGVDLRGANLQGADLHAMSLTGADLRGADLRRANLGGAVLIGVDLRDAKVAGANFSHARLTGCDLRGDALNDATTTGIELIGSELSD